jgi:hypothetical protein
LTDFRRFRGAALLLSLAAVACPAVAQDGSLVGWVEDTRGLPIAGAVISLFGKDATGAGFVALSDEAGRFFVPSLPAGSYTLRALGRGHVPAPAQEITVLPNQDAVFSVSLTPIRWTTEKEASYRTRELRWLLRHKPRSVLEDEDPVLGVADHPEKGDLAPSPELAGSVEVVTNPTTVAGAEGTNDGAPTGVGAVRIGGRLGDGAEWSLAGLRADSESAAWRMAAEFSVEPGAGHTLAAGVGYGSRILRPAVSSGNDLETRGMGALFLEDRWTSGPLTASAGAHYTYIGYLGETNHVDPSAGIELHRSDGARLRGAFSQHTLLPGGDLLTVSTLSSAPTIAYAVMDPALRPEHSTLYELALDRPFGATLVSARAFQEDITDQLVNAFDASSVGAPLHIVNGRGLSSRGVGVTVGHHVGGALKGSLTYTYGHCKASEGLVGPMVAFDHGEFHDFVARFESFIDRSGTRVLVFYRVNSLSPEAYPSAAAPIVTSRYDLQLRQGLPFIGEITRADWELLVAFRNLFYEESDGALMDEIAVVNPPKRVLGGISVRF